MKKHMKKHSYKQVEFRCEECDFLGATPFTMEVLLRKSHSDHFECGLCELFTCDIYQLIDCEQIIKKVTKIKEYITENHSNYIIHAKQKRADIDEWWNMALFQAKN